MVFNQIQISSACMGFVEYSKRSLLINRVKAGFWQLQFIMQVAKKLLSKHLQVQEADF